MAMLRSCLLAAAGLLAVACSSAPPSNPDAPSEPLRVGYVDYRNQTVLELVNTAHTDRLEQYSQVRESASRKVQSNEVMQALVEFLDQNGFPELAQPGRAPAQADERVLWSLELERGGAASHVTYPAGLPADQKRRYGLLWQAFLDTYNSTYSLQAVKVKAGETPFQAPEGAKRKN